MVTRKLGSEDRKFLRLLGKKIQNAILKERGYRSLDAFALEFYDLIAKPTLYEICAGKRDMKVSTLRGLALALDLRLEELLSIDSKSPKRSNTFRRES